MNMKTLLLLLLPINFIFADVPDEISKGRDQSVRAALCHDQSCAEKAFSATYAPATIAKGISKIMEYLKMSDTSEVVAQNDKQESFINRYISPNGVDMISGLANELRAWVSKDISKLNEVLKNEGFNIQLKEDGRDSFGVVAILKVALEWKQKAKKSMVTHAGQQYPAIELSGKKHDCQVVRVEGYAHPVIMIKTKTNDTVYLSVADKPLKDEELRDKVLFLARKEHSKLKYDSVTVPMVDLNVEQQLDWLIGLTFTDGHFISQALQQTKFKMNEEGVRVEDAAAIVVTRCVPTTYIVDKPFLAWIIRDGMQEPYFSAYVTPNDWKNPEA